MLAQTSEIASKQMKRFRLVLGVRMELLYYSISLLLCHPVQNCVTRTQHFRAALFVSGKAVVPILEFCTLILRKDLRSLTDFWSPKDSSLSIFLKPQHSSLSADVKGPISKRSDQSKRLILCKIELSGSNDDDIVV